MDNAHGRMVREKAREEAAQSALAASWRRSLEIHRLDPDVAPPHERADSSMCARAREKLGRISAIAAPAMDRLFAAVGESGCSVLLTDAAGLIVERRGRAADDGLFRDWGLWTGADWSESAEGTNGIGTCLVEQRPVVVHRDQHFASRNTVMSCMGAPIFGHDGALVGVLDISSCRTDLAGVIVKLLADAVADAARRIEAENFQAAYEGCRIVVGRGDGAGGPVLFAVDRDDLLVGATRRARKSYRLSDESFAVPIHDVVRDITHMGGDLDAAERAELRRALASAGGNAAQAARGLGVSRATLYRRMARLGLSVRD